MAAAVVGLLAVQQTSSRPRRAAVVVAATDLPAGRVLSPADLAAQPLDVRGALAGRTFADPAALVGRVLAATLAAGDVVQPSALSSRAVDPSVREVSFAADPARSLGQRIRPGDLVDVYAADGEGGAARARAVVRRARVVDRQGRQGASGFIYTVALADPRDVEALVAAATGALSVVRAEPGPGGGSGAAG